MTQQSTCPEGVSRRLRPPGPRHPPGPGGRPSPQAPAPPVALSQVQPRWARVALSSLQGRAQKPVPPRRPHRAPLVRPPGCHPRARALGHSLRLSPCRELRPPYPSWALMGEEAAPSQSPSAKRGRLTGAPAPGRPLRHSSVFKTYERTSLPRPFTWCAPSSVLLTALNTQPLKRLPGSPGHLPGSGAGPLLRASEGGVGGQRVGAQGQGWRPQETQEARSGGTGGASTT